jgi:hypothetical protein
MFVDAATLQDLDVLPAPGVGGTTLWSLVDFTRSRVGRQALRDRLLNPPHTADQILALQQAHQELAAEAEAYRGALDRIAADEVERYLDARWQLPRDMPAFVRLRAWHRQYVTDAERGRLLVSSLLESAGDLRGRLAAANAATLRALGTGGWRFGAAYPLKRPAIRRTSLAAALMAPCRSTSSGIVLRPRTACAKRKWLDRRDWPLPGRTR